MASRTSASVGMGITVTLLGLLLLTTFILAIVFYGRSQRLSRDLSALQQLQQDIVAPGEANTDRVRNLITDARKGRKSLVTYLDESLQTSMGRLTGARQDTVEQMAEKLKAIEGADTAPLVRVVAGRDADIERLNKALDDATQARQAAEADLQAEVDRVTRIQSDTKATITALNDEIGRYKAELDRYRSSVTSTIEQNNSRVESIRASTAQSETALQDRIAELEQKVVIQEDAISQMRKERAGEVFKPRDEFALVDARVVSTEAAQRQAFIDVGRDKRVILGMTFEVYSDASQIRADDSGEYPRGKATLEVIRIDENSAVCRIVRENRGNPVVVGDVLANAVYDPNKMYSFVVFGNFDANRDGVATPQEKNGIVGLINGWGGRVVNDLSGQTDFLVLGQRPILPPAPPPDAPIAVIQEYIRKQRDAQEYDRLFETATQTSIPVLNENRLYTLTGYAGAGQ